MALYSLFEMIASVWEISRGVTLFPEVLQVWFDFGHDQVHYYYYYFILVLKNSNFDFIFVFSFLNNNHNNNKGEGNDCVGVRVPVTVCGLSGNSAGEGVKRGGHV